jgi:class 3 adenylate cyclase
VWINPSGRNLAKVFNHLRSLQRILYDYLPRQVLSSLPNPGENRSQWEEGTLLFTNLAGITPLLDANANLGQEGATALWELFNDYFTEMLRIVGNGGGNLLEFTGDAILVLFQADQQQPDTARAVRVGLRMQRATEKFSSIKNLG